MSVIQIHQGLVEQRAQFKRLRKWKNRKSLYKFSIFEFTPSSLQQDKKGKEDGHDIARTYYRQPTWGHSHDDYLYPARKQSHEKVQVTRQGNVQTISNC